MAETRASEHDWWINGLLQDAEDAARWRAVRDQKLVGMKRGDLEWLVDPEYWPEKYPTAADFDAFADRLIAAPRAPERMSDGIACLTGCCKWCGAQPKIEQGPVNDTVCVSIEPSCRCGKGFNIWPTDPVVVCALLDAASVMPNDRPGPTESA